MSDPIVDILITVFNGEKYLVQALESLTQQTMRDIRIHVVNDGSQDGTAGLLAAMAQHEPRLQVYDRPHAGIVESANFGLTQCDAEFVARFDADDICAPDRIERQVAYLRAHPDVIAVAARADHIDADGRRTGTYAQFPSPDLADPTAIPAVEPYLLHPFLMVRRAALMRLGGYRHTVVAEDLDLYWRLQEIGGIANDDAVLGQYRKHDDSISSKSIWHGRLAAVASQLTALSALRRRNGLADFPYAIDAEKSLKIPGRSLAEMCASVNLGLTPAENEHLQLAAAVKLLDFAGYRPYELERSDCDFIIAVMRRFGDRMPADQRKMVLRSVSGAAARLAAKGQWQEARILINADTIWPAFGKFILRRLMPQALWKTIRRKLRGND